MKKLLWIPALIIAAGICVVLVGSMMNGGNDAAPIDVPSHSTNPPVLASDNDMPSPSTNPSVLPSDNGDPSQSPNDLEVPASEKPDDHEEEVAIATETVPNLSRSFEAITAKFGPLEKVSDDSNVQKYQNKQYELRFRNGLFSSMILLNARDIEKVDLTEMEAMDMTRKLLEEYEIPLETTSFSAVKKEGANTPWTISYKRRDAFEAIVMRGSVDIDQCGRVTRFSIIESPTPVPTTAPLISREEAITAAVKDIVANNEFNTKLNADEVLVKKEFTVSSAELYALEETRKWTVVIEGLRLTDGEHVHSWLLSVDADTGEILLRDRCR